MARVRVGCIIGKSIVVPVHNVYKPELMQKCSNIFQRVENTMHDAFCTGHQLVLSRFEQDEQSIQIRLVTQVNKCELRFGDEQKVLMHSATKTVTHNTRMGQLSRLHSLYLIFDIEGMECVQEENMLSQKLANTSDCQ